jgi:carbamoyl-phosphate synthase large subunit
VPSRNIPEKHLKTLEEYSKRIAKELKVKGLMNIQFAICNDVVYILEANPRASRTVPLVSKVMNIQMARIATQILIGKKLKDLKPKQAKKIDHMGVKEAVFPFSSYPSVDPVLGPEMKSTGEVLGMAPTFGLAYYKAQESTGLKLPTSGTVFISVNDDDKGSIIEPAKKLVGLGFKIKATRGTKELLEKNGIQADLAVKMHEGRPNITDDIANKQVNLIINTPVGRASKYDDGYIRKAAIKHKIPYITTIAAAKAAVEGIEAVGSGGIKIKALQDYHK